MALQHLRSFLDTSAVYLGLRSEGGRQAREENPGGESPDGDLVPWRKPGYAGARDCPSAGGAA